MTPTSNHGSRWPRVLVALLLAGGAGTWLVRRSSRSHRPEEMPGETARETHLSPRPARRPPVFRSAASTGPNVPSWFVQPGLPTREIAGRVLRDGQPAAGVPLTLESQASAADPTLRKRTTSRADGGFTFGLQPAGPYDLMAYPPEGEPTHVLVDLRNPLADPRPERVVLAVQPCRATISGLVTDKTAGTPVSGARVLLLPFRSASHLVGLASVTGGSGDYTMCVAPGADLLLRVEAAGYAAAIVPAESDARRDIQLVTESIVEGTTADKATGAALSGVQVIATPLSDAETAPSTALSDAGGRFELHALRAGTRYSINGLRSDFTAEETMVVEVAPGRTTGLVRRLAAASRVEGVVRLQGRPLMGAGVRFDRYPHGFSFTSISQADGRFTLHGVPRGAGTLFVDRFRVLSPARLEVTAPEQRDVVVEVEPLRR